MNSDWLEHFSLLKFAIMAGIYSLLVFATGRRSGMIFSKRNAMPTSTVFAEHLKFLTILLLLLWAVTSLYPHLPEWSKAVRYTGRSDRGSSSGVDLGFLVAMIAMFVMERRRIYIEADTESEDAQ